MSNACFGRPCDSCLFDTCPRSKINKAREYMSECCEKRKGYEGWRVCGTCPFSLTNNKYSVPCGYLTDDQIINIYSLNKEDKAMTKKEEIQKEIDKTQEQLVKLYKTLEEAKNEELEKAKNEVPETLGISEGDRYDYVDSDGDICWTCYSQHASLGDTERVRHRRAFLSERYARIFADKTQFIADLLHFKYLYDKDYEPNWDLSTEMKWTVIFDHAIYKGEGRLNKYIAVWNSDRELTETIYFSTQELAERCAAWLNKKYGYTKE